MLKLKLQYFGLLIWRADSLEKNLLLGKTKSKRSREQQRMRWLDPASMLWMQFEQILWDSGEQRNLIWYNLWDYRVRYDLATGQQQEMVLHLESLKSEVNVSARLDSHMEAQGKNTLSQNYFTQDFDKIQFLAVVGLVSISLLAISRGFTQHPEVSFQFLHEITFIFIYSNSISNIFHVWDYLTSAAATCRELCLPLH